MNILITSCGTRNKIIQYFKHSLAGQGRVITTDASPYAPALYEADNHYVVPRIDSPDYMDVIYNICRKEKISGILSLIDPELSLLAAHKNELNNIGVTVVGSSEGLCNLSLNKWAMYEWLQNNGYKTALTFNNPQLFFKAVEDKKIHYPVFVKPQKGSASLSISKAEDEKTVALLTEKQNDLIIQEYMQGQEIGADCYIDMISGECVSIFTRKKLVMRAGETDKGVSFKDPKLFELIKDFVKKAGFTGQIDIDLFDINGEYYISEVNPRFGGGYPHAYECGTDHMKLIINNLKGITNPPAMGNYEEGLVMMKYNEISLTRFVD